MKLSEFEKLKAFVGRDTEAVIVVNRASDVRELCATVISGKHDGKPTYTLLRQAWSEPPRWTEILKFIIRRPAGTRPVPSEKWKRKN